jgi:hypothetical protein
LEAKIDALEALTSTKIAFRTSVDLEIEVHFLDVLDADKECQNLAEAASLATAGKPQFKAWMSLAGTSPLDRFTKSLGPYVNTNGNDAYITTAFTTGFYVYIA